MKASQLESLERLYRRRFPKDALYSPEQARELALLSHTLNRQVALLIDRAGKPQMVIAGNANSIYIPELPRLPAGRLRGLRLLHTHLGEAGLDDEDLLDMLFLRFDAIFSLTVNSVGEPVQWQGGWLLPADAPNLLLEIPGAKTRFSSYLSNPKIWHLSQCEHTLIAEALEQSLDKSFKGSQPTNQAILISVSQEARSLQESHLDELAALCRSAGLNAAGRLIQRSQTGSSANLLGKGKMAELEIMALAANAEILIFDGELTPAQLHNLADLTERRVLDRTQLILDIFAQNATSNAGKLQVELAQLAYAQPRLAGGHKAMDRLAGGIGGRGPGETRLETDRRKLKTRMAFLKKELAKLEKQRRLARARRERNRIPVAAFVGYTNAGKSTLLNLLTRSGTLTANKLFATLDPVTRRLRFPEEKEITLSDTVGFIRNLPKELTDAFAATLEELHNADLLIHVADASHPEMTRQMEAVETTLEDLGLTDKPRILTLNKMDKVNHDSWHLPGAIPVSATTGLGIKDLLNKMEQLLFLEKTASSAIS